MSAVRLALIGLGNMGMAHLELFAGLAPAVRVAAVADSHPPFADRAGSLVPSAVVFRDPLECLHDADIDAAVVATADDTHHRIVEAGIARGIHVLCEKPFSTSAENSWQLVEAERATGRRLVQLGYMRRYDDDYRGIRDTLRSGRVGAPILISQHHRNPLAVNAFDAPRLILNSASHEIDLFRWLTGEEITEVSAAAKTSADQSALTVLLTWKSQSGILGVVECSRGPGLHYDIGCQLVAERGELGVAAPPSDSWFERFAAAYRAQDAHWVAAVAADSMTGPSAYDGYAANAVADAALAALDSHSSQPVLQR